MRVLRSDSLLYVMHAITVVRSVRDSRLLVLNVRLLSIGT